MRTGLIPTIILAICSFALAGDTMDLDPLTLRRHLAESVGNLPWNLQDGFILEGQFQEQRTNFLYQRVFSGRLRRQAPFRARNLRHWRYR